MLIDDSFYMGLAVDEAWKYQLLTLPNPAVGCVVVKQGKIIAIQAHQQAGKAHAEVLALLSALQLKSSSTVYTPDSAPQDLHKFIIDTHDGFFHDCDIYVTLEPCAHTQKTPACADLLSVVQPQRVIIGRQDPHKKAAGGIKKLRQNSIEVTKGVLEEKCDALLYPFKKILQGNFSFFKMALRLNGSIDGGYISSKEALNFVHKVRSTLPWLAIGGNTVRIDRPTLDCRFIFESYAPNILIYTRKERESFDQSIPLFQKENRKVEFTSSSQKIFNKSIVMIEGGYNLLLEFIEKIDLLVLVQSHSMKSTQNVSQNMHSIDLDFEILHQRNIGKDTIIYLKRRL